MKRTAALAAAAAIIGGAAYGGDEAASGAGDEVKRICFGGNISNFKTIKGEDDAVLLERGVNDWYKATLLGACNYSRIRSAQSVAIQQLPPGGCVTPGDYLIFSESAFGDFSFHNSTRCVISRIYKWNPKAGEPGDSAADTED